MSQTAFSRLDAQIWSNSMRYTVWSIAVNESFSVTNMTEAFPKSSAKTKLIAADSDLLWKGGCEMIGGCSAR